MVTKILIPKVNQYPFEKVEKWAKEYYRKAEAQVSSQKAKKIKEQLPIEMASYCEKMTFVSYRLTGPGPGRPDKEAPLEIVLECLRPYIIKSIWGQFRPKFISLLTQSFTAICNSNYRPAMVNQMNDSINELLREFAKKVGAGHSLPLHLDFVLHPETAESYSSPEMFKLRSLIWEYFGIRLDPKQYQISSELIPGRPRQMEMHLDLSITLKFGGHDTLNGMSIVSPD